MKDTIYHVAHDLDLEGHPDRERILNARQTWEVVKRIDGRWRPSLFNAEGRRTSRDLGDARSVPYIGDLLDFGVELAGEAGIVCWSNLDVCLVPEAAAVIRHKLSLGRCCHSRRIDVADATVRRSWRELEGLQPSKFADLVLGAVLIARAEAGIDRASPF